MIIAAANRKFADLAISLNVDCLITNDKHFKVFKKLDFPKLTVMTPRQFEKFLNKFPIK